jgi:alkanesulfonate monooxygenase
VDSDRPRIWVTFRPIIAETEDLAWAKAHKTLDALIPTGGNIKKALRACVLWRWRISGDLALPLRSVGARGASTALVGSPKTVVESLLDYIDLGADLISIRGYDIYMQDMR